MESIRRGFGALTETANRTFGASSDANSSFILPYVVGIIGVALIVVIVYVLFQTTRSLPAKTLKGPVDLFEPQSPVVISRADTKTLMNGSYTLSFYLRADAVPDMRAQATPLFTWPGIWNLGYNAAKEELVWTVLESSSGQPAGVSESRRIILPKVPLQRWTQVVMAFEGRTMDLYVNGALIKSETLQNLPPKASASITIVPGGIMGKTAYVQLWSRRLTVGEVAGNYTDTSDSQGRPLLGPEFFKALTNFSIPNLFSYCGAQPTASLSQTWEFPYA